MKSTRLFPLMLLGCACSRSATESEAVPSLRVRCVEVGPHAFDEVLTVPGRVEPPPGGDLPVASQVAGRIARLLVHEGQQVGRGDAVAVVDDASSRDALHQAQATLAQARASESNARATLDRIDALVARGIAARQELDDARTRAETERQSVRSTQAAVDLAERTLSRVTIQSTVAGTVTRIWRGPGSLVDGTSSTPIVQVAASAAADFVTAATLTELAKLQVGQSARIELESENFAHAGQVRMRSSAIDPTTGLGSVRIALEDLDGGVIMGTYGRAHVTLRHREGVTAIPTEALRGALADGAEVVVCSHDKAELRPVNVGYRDAQFAEVVSGLSPGERVAIDHVMGLATGTAIEVGD